MKKITSVFELRVAIKLLEIKQANEARLLKEQFNTVYESLKPVNVLKNAFNSLTRMPDFREGIVNTTLGLTTSHFAKKIIVGSTGGPLKQFFGIMLQMGLANLISKNGDNIKSAGINLLKRFLNNGKEKEGGEHFVSFNNHHK